MRERLSRRHSHLPSSAIMQYCITVLMHQPSCEDHSTWFPRRIKNPNRTTEGQISNMKVELSLHASNLKNTTSFGTSDPYAVVTHVSTQVGMKPEVIGKTETWVFETFIDLLRLRVTRCTHCLCRLFFSIANSLSPNWASVFTIDFELGKPLIVAVQVYDQVRKGSNKPMGSATFDIGECLGARGNTKAKKFKNGGT